MTTKEFIEILQKADPEGNGHIRLGDGIPMWAEAKPGYWDGAYDYINDEGQYVRSTKGYKVDIACMDIWDFVERNYHRHNPEKNTWEYIQSLFKFELTYTNAEQRTEREQCVLKEAKEAYESEKEMEEEHFKEHTDRAIQRESEGYRFFQNKKVDSDNMFFYYQWKIVSPDGKESSSSFADTEGIIWSGLFERVDNDAIEGYYEWVKIKEEK